MKFKLFLLLLLFFINTHAQQVVELQKTVTFFPDWKEIKKDKIDWYYLIVPENYDKPDGRKIKLAVTVVRSLAKTNNAVLFIQGGPGGSTISGLGRWLDHPLRNTGDIVLIDIRGTGFSEPTMCPDLGKKFFEIFSKNQDAEKDAMDKVKVSLDCQQDLINKGIDINSYNSNSISKDLNALKRELKITDWNVYGESYGTYLGQEYARNFPADIRSLILDSSIPAIAEYYNKNTSNYVSSLTKLFLQCKNDPESNREFPDLESVYYTVIDELSKNPITVKVAKSVLPSKTFTFNAEDFKIAVHQAFYQKKLIEVLPLLIYQFHYRNENALSAMVAAFSGALSLDYGAYYCSTCNEAIPNNNIDSFNRDAAASSRLKGGLSFYKSDFDVCAAWNKKAHTNVPITGYKKDNQYPVLIFSGEFDPITSTLFADQTAANYNNSHVMFVKAFGHGPSFSEKGSDMVNNFVNVSGKKVDTARFRASIRFVSKISLNKGVFNFGTSVSNFDWVFFVPLFVSIFIQLGFLAFVLTRIKKSGLFVLNSIIAVAVITGLLGIGVLTYAVIKSTAVNRYIAAFGLLETYSFVFFIQKAGAVLCFISLLYFIITGRKTNNFRFYLLVIFSMLVLNGYYLWWNFF